jgi:hypothetical protein
MAPLLVAERAASRLSGIWRRHHPTAVVNCPDIAVLLAGGVDVSSAQFTH